MTFTQPITLLCISAASEAEARKKLEDMKVKGVDIVRTVAALPYPCTPRVIDSAEPFPVCPPFCYTPDECKGHSSCPHAYACSE